MEVIMRSSSRRRFLETGAALAATAVVSSEVFAQRSREPGRRLLLKGGTIVTMDPKIGNFAAADLLIEGKKIAAVATDIKTSADVIDASDTILIPGFVDCHRH